MRPFSSYFVCLLFIGTSVLSVPAAFSSTPSSPLAPGHMLADYTGACFDITSPYTFNANVTFTSGNCSFSANITQLTGLTFTVKDTVLRTVPPSWDRYTFHVNGKFVLNNATMMTEGAGNGMETSVETNAILDITNNCKFNSILEFRLMWAGNSTIKDSTFTGTGWSPILMDWSGNVLISGNTFIGGGGPAMILRNSANVTIVNNTIRNNPDNFWGSVYLDFCYDARVVNNTFQNNAIAMHFYGPIGSRTLLAANNTLSGNTLDFQLNFGAQLMVYNTSYSTVIFDNQGIVYWTYLYDIEYVDLEFLWESDMTPVEGANVDIRNSTDDSAFSADTDASGNLSHVLLIKKERTRGWTMFQTPHLVDISANRGGKSYLLNYTINITKGNHFILLVDDLPPLLNITSPAQGQFINKNMVTVKGRTDVPETGKPFTLRVGNGQDLYDATRDATGNFSVDVPLTKEGGNIITITATDWVGNVAQVKVDVIRDTIPPNLKITSPVDWLMTNITNVTVTGETEPTATLKIKGKSVPVRPDGTFSEVVNLTENINVIDVKAWDLANNTRTEKVNVTLDTIPPTLTLVQPLGTEVLTNIPQFTIEGDTGSTDDVVKIDGVQMGSAAKHFTKTILLKEGQQYVMVTSQDIAGNVATIALNVTLDTRPPVITILSPAEGIFLNQTYVIIDGVTEPDITELKMGDEVIEIDENGSFSEEYFLQEGKNTISFTAKDAAGNVGNRLLKVNVDTNPPKLAVTSPKDRTRTNQPTIEISGTVERGCSVTANGKAALVSAETFSITVDLVEGDNLFNIRAWDTANNTNTTSIRIFLDTIVELTVTEPVDGAALEQKDANVTVKGKMEPGGTVAVMGKNVTVNANGDFSIIVVLTEGNNTIDIMGTDALGNVRGISRNVTLTIKDYGDGGGGKGDAISNMMMPLLLLMIILAIAVTVAVVVSRRKGPAGPGTEQKEKRKKGDKKLAEAIAQTPPPATEPMELGLYTTAELTGQQPPQGSAWAQDTYSADTEMAYYDSILTNFDKSVMKVEEAIEKAMKAGEDVTEARKNLKFAVRFQGLGNEEKATHYLEKAKEAMGMEEEEGQEEGGEEEEEIVVGNDGAGDVVGEEGGEEQPYADATGTDPGTEEDVSGEEGTDGGRGEAEGPGEDDTVGPK